LIAAIVFGPITPSGQTPIACCNSIAARPGPLLTAQSKTARSTPAGSSSPRTLRQ
jgi:hypothetical protein